MSSTRGMSDKNHRKPPPGGAPGVGGTGVRGFWKGLAHFANDFKEQGVIQKLSANTKEVWLNPIREIAKDIGADVKEALRPGGASDAHAALRAAAADTRRRPPSSSSGGASHHSNARGQGGHERSSAGSGASSASKSRPGGGSRGGCGGGGGAGAKGQAGQAGKQLDSIFASFDPSADPSDEAAADGEVVTGGLNEGRGHKRHGHGAQNDGEGTTASEMMAEAADSLKSDMSVTAAFAKIQAMRVGGGGGGGTAGSGGGGGGVGAGGAGGGGSEGLGGLLRPPASKWEPVPEPVRRIAAAAADAVRGQLTVVACAVAVLLLVVGVIAWEHTSTTAAEQKGAEAHAATAAAVHPDPTPTDLGLGQAPGPAAAPEATDGLAEVVAAASKAAGVGAEAPNEGSLPGAEPVAEAGGGTDQSEATTAVASLGRKFLSLGSERPATRRRHRVTSHTRR